MTKEEMRREIALAVQSMTAEDRLVADAQIATQLIVLPEWRNSRRVFAYVPMIDEVDISPVLAAVFRAGKELVLPRVTGTRMTFHSVGNLAELERHAMGFLQPPEGVEIRNPTSGDLILVPGRAFSRAGHRLGRGRGYYDRFLAGIPQEVVTIGLAYDVQMRRSIPSGASDMTVQVIITDLESVFCRRASV